MNNARTRMEVFGDRLIRLIAEAYAEGVVLSIPEPEGGFVLIDPPEGQRVLSISAPIPHLGLTHLSLKRPERIVVHAVVTGNIEGSTDLVPPVTMPLPKTT